MHNFYKTVFYYTNIPPKKQKKILTTSVVAIVALSMVIWSLGIPLGQIFSLKTARAAAPAFSAVKYKSGSSKLLVVFDQWDIFTADPTASTTGLWGSQGALTAADFVISGTAGLTISSVSHDGGGKQAILTLSGNISVSASGQLIVGCVANAIYNRGGEACTQTGYDVYTTGTADTAAPTISWLNPMGQNGLEIQFSEPMDATTGAAAANYTLNTSNTTDPYDGTATIAVQGGATSNYSITRQSWDPKTIRLDLWNATIDPNKTSGYDQIVIGIGVTDIFGNALASASTQDIKYNTGGYMESARFEGAFQKVLAYGKATSGNTTTLTDSAASWSTNAFANMVLYIVKGTNVGASKTISSNTGTVITVGSAFSSALDNTSRYEVRDPKRVYAVYSKNMEKVSMEKASYYTLSTQDAGDTITITSITQQSNNSIAEVYAANAIIVGTDNMSQNYNSSTMNFDTLKVKCEMDTMGPTDLDGRIQMSCWDMPIEVGTPPLVEGVAIDASQATGVNDVGKKIRIKFDKPLDESTALNTAAYTFASGATVATFGTGMPMLDMGMRQVVLTVASGTIGSYVNLATPGTGGPVDLLGQAVTNLGDDCSTVSGKVRCNIDATRPTITKISANRGTDNTFNNGDTVTLTFSEAMNKWSANNAWSFEPLYGSECNVANIVLGNYTTTQNCQWGYWGDGAAMAWNTAGTQAIITLGNYSNIGEGYIIKPWFDSWSGSGVSDLSGNSIDYANSIKTIDTSTASLLKLIWTDTDANSGTSSGDTIRLNFSKSIDTATVSYASMDTLFAVGGGGTTWGGTNLISADLTWASSNTGLIVRLKTPPSGTLIANGHTVTPSTNVKDANGNSVSTAAVTFRSSGPTVTSLKTSVNPTQSRIWLRFAEPIINVSNLAYPSQTLTATNYATSAQLATSAFTFTDASSGGVVISGIDFVSADGKDAILALSGKVATNDTLNVTALKGTVSQINFAGNTTLQTGYSGDFTDATAPTISLVSVKRMSSSSGTMGANETINPGDKIIIEFSEAIDPGSIFNFSTQRWNLDTALKIGDGVSKSYGQYPMVNWLNSNQKLEITLDAPASGKTLPINGDVITATTSVSDYVGNGASNSLFTINSAVPKIISVKFTNQGVATPDTGDTLSVVFNQTMDTSLDSITTDCSEVPTATNLGGVINNALWAENPATYIKRTSAWGTSPTVKWSKNIVACDTLRVILGSTPAVTEGDRIWTDMSYIKTKSGGNITNFGALDYTGPQLKDAWLVFDANSNGVGNAGDKIFFSFNEPMNANTIASSNTDLPLSSGGNYGTEATISWKSQSTLEVTLGTTGLVDPVGKTVNPPDSVTDINGNIDNSSAVTVQVPAAGLSPVTAVTFTDPDTTGPGIDKMDIRVDFTDSSAVSGRYYNIFLLPETVPFALSEATGTADSGSTITLVDADGSLSSTINIYRGKELHIIGGTGAGQHQTIQDYNGTTKTITVDTAFSAALDNTSIYEIRNYHSINNAPVVSVSGTTSYSYSGLISSYALFDDSRFAYLPTATPPPSWMTFYPLMPNANYKVYVNACTDAACNNYSMPVASAVFQFIGEMNGGSGLGGGGGGGINFFAPQVWGCLPWSGATDIPTNLTFAACKFSQSMDSTTVNSTNVTIKKVSDNSSVPASVYYSSEQEAAFIKFQTGSTLTASTKYKIEISASVKSSGGVNIMNAWYSDFTTGTGADGTSPKIMDNKFESENLCTSGAGTVSSPCAGAEISRIYEIGFRFDEDMDPSTLDNTSVILTNTTDSLAVSGEFNYDPMWRGGMFMLSSVLQASKTYRLTVSGSLIKDDAGNFFDGDKDTVAGGDYNYYFNTIDSTGGAFAAAAPKVKWAFADGFHLGVGFGDPKFDATAIAIKESTVTNASNWTLESPTGTVVSLSGANFHYDPFANETHIDGLSLISGSSFKITASANIKGFNGISIDAGNNSFTGVVEGFKGSGAIGSGGPCSSCDTSKPTNVNTMMFMPINVWPMNSISGQVSNYMVNVPLTKAINNGGKVLIQFPTGFDVSNAALASADTEAFMNQDLNGPGVGVITVSAVNVSTTNNTVTLTLATGGSGTSTMTNDFLGFMLKGIVNGDPSQVTYSTTNPDGIGGHQATINTKNADGKLLEGPISSMRFPIEKGGSGMVTGTVTKSDGTTAVANVKVFLDSPRGMHLEKTTGSDGKFTFTGLPTSSDLGVTYWLFVEAKSTAVGDFFGSQSVEVKLTDASPIVRDKTIKLQTGDKTISGTLTYANSLQNKKVVVNVSGPNGWLEKEVTLSGATTQAYTLSVMTGDWNINVQPYFPKDNFMAGPPPAMPFMPPTSQFIKVTTANIANVDFSLTVPDKVISGTVKDQNGNGLSGVGVWAYDPGGVNGFGANTQTLSDGSYTLNVLTGTYKIGAAVPGMPSVEEKSITAPASGINFTLSKADNSVKGSVFDESGKPIPGAGVEAYNNTTKGFIFAPTNAQGFYVLFLPTGTWTLKSFAPGYGQIMTSTGVATYSLTIVANDVLTGKDFKAGGNGAATMRTISGYVCSSQKVDSASNLLAGCKSGYEVSGVMVGAEEVVTATGVRTGNYNEVATGSDGTFSIKVPANVTANSYNVWAYIPGVGELDDVTGINIKDANASTTEYSGLTLVAPDTKTVNINFKDSNGAAFTVKEAFVDAWDPTTFKGNKIQINNSSTGTLDLPNGTYEMVAHIPGFGQIGADGGRVSVSRDNQAVNFTIVVSSTFTIQGIVYKPDGSTVISEAWVQVFDPSTKRGNDDKIGPSDSGAFSISVPTGGSYTLIVETPPQSGYMGYKHSSAITAAINLSGANKIVLAAADSSVSGKIYTDTAKLATATQAFVRAEEVGGTRIIMDNIALGDNGVYSMNVPIGTQWNITAMTPDGKFVESQGVTAGSTSVNNAAKVDMSATASITGFSKPEPSSTTISAGKGKIIEDSTNDIKMVIEPSDLGSSGENFVVEIETMPSIHKTQSTEVFSPEEKEITIYQIDSSGKKTKVGNTNSSIDISLLYDKSDFTDISAGNTALNPASLKEVELAPWDDTSGNTWSSSSTTKKVKVKDLVSSSWRNESIDTFITNVTSASGNYTGVNYYDFEIEFTTATTHFSPFGTPTGTDLTPVAPTVKPSVSAADGQVTLGWVYTFNESDGSYFNLYRSTQDNFSSLTQSQLDAKQVNTSAISIATYCTGSQPGPFTCSYNDVSVSNGSTYYYIYTAVDSGHKGDTVTNTSPTSNAAMPTSTGGGGGGGGGGVVVTPTLTPKPETIVPTITATFKTGDLIRAIAGTKVYVIKNGKKRWIPTAAAFNASGYKWAEIKDVGASDVSGTKDITLFRAEGDPKVYILASNGKRRHIPNPEVFASYGFDWGEVSIITKAERDAYTDMTLMRITGDPKIYRLVNGAISHISDPKTFNSYGYSWDDVVEMNAIEFAVYKKGDVSTPTTVETIVTEIPASYKFSKKLEYNSKGDDAKYLQIFLKSQGSDIYPEAIVSGWFGPATKRALIRFQEKYTSDILTPFDITQGTGITGSKTNDKINKILGR